jgi:hypothetical protein
LKQNKKVGGENRFLLSTYEIWEVLVSLAIFFIADFHVLGLFIPKKQV